MIDVIIFTEPSGNVRGLVNQDIEVNGKKRKLAHATLLTDGAPNIIVKMPPSMSLTEVLDASNLLKEFHDKVQELDRARDSASPASDATTQAPASLTRGELGFQLAAEALEQVEGGTLTVSAVLSVDHPETLRNFDTFKQILLGAHDKGRAAGREEAAQAMDERGGRMINASAAAEVIRDLKG